MESVFVIGAVIGFTQLVKSLFDKDYRSAVIIAGSAAIGGIAGFLAVDSLTVTTGILAGLTASGFVTVSQALGGRSISVE
jgi:hypothetical protein